MLQVERQEAATGEKSDKALAPVLDNSLAWGGFMAGSSNTRYQIVNTLEERLLVSRLLLHVIHRQVDPIPEHVHNRRAPFGEHSAITHNP